jgi:DNA-directed RNA polymerase subunit beta'
MALHINNSSTLYNNKIIVPDAFKAPEWFFKTKEIYRNTVLKSIKDNGSLKKEVVIKLIEEIIENKFKVKYPLNKDNVAQLYSDLYKHFESEAFIWKYQLIYELGFFLSTLKPSSFSPESMILPEKFKIAKEAIKNQYENSPKKEKDIIKANKDLDKLAEEVMQYFRDNNIYAADLIDSGSKGSVDDIRKLLLGVGLSINAKGEINDVILKAHSEGLDKTQFFNYSSQGIVSLYSKSMNTAKPGYLIRQLYTIMETLNLSKDVDCGTQKYFEFKIPKASKDTNKILFNLKGRSYLDSTVGIKGLSLVPTDTKEASEKLAGKTIKLRSPLYCQSRDGICKTCYGPLAAEELQMNSSKGGSKIGQISVASLAESLVNITLKASHTGLSLDSEEVDLTKDIERYSK